MILAMLLKQYYDGDDAVYLLHIHFNAVPATEANKRIRVLFWPAMKTTIAC